MGCQEQSALKVPWLSCAVVQVLVCNTVRKCMQTSKHMIGVHGSSIVWEEGVDNDDNVGDEDAHIMSFERSDAEEDNLLLNESEGGNS